MAQHLYPTMCEHIASEGLCSYIWPCLKTLHWKGSALIFDHVRKHRIKRALHLHLTMCKHTASKGLTVPDLGFLVTDQVPPLSQRMASTLISDQVGTHPSITSEWPCTHIWSCKTTSHSHIRMALSPKLSIPSNWPGASIQRMAFSTYIWSCGNTSLNHTRMALHLYLIMWEHIPQSYQNGPWSRLSFPGNWLGASIQRMAFSTYIWSCRDQSYSHIKMA